MDKPYAIFDMDGTLVDSMGYWDGLGAEYLRAHGVTGDISETLRQTVPMTVRESAGLFVRRFSLPQTPEEAMDEMYRRMEEHYRHDVPLKAGIKEYLSALLARGVRLCVASATEERLVRACLARLGCLDCFSFVLSCETMQTSKRSPEIYLAAAARFGAVPAQVAVYEDALYAARTAKTAGFYVVAVQDSSEPGWETLRTLADEVFPGV